MALRSRKVAPEPSIAMKERFVDGGERESGEGCSRESISDEQALLDDSQHGSTRKLVQSSAVSDGGTSGGIELRPESRIGRRFVRYRNSWIGESCVVMNLDSVSHAAARSRIEEADEGSYVCMWHRC